MKIASDRIYGLIACKLSVKARLSPAIRESLVVSPFLVFQQNHSAIRMVCSNMKVASETIVARARVQSKNSDLPVLERCV